MPLNGQLNDMSLLDLIDVFHIGAKSGILYLAQNKRLGLLYVGEGQLVDAVVLTWPERTMITTGDAAVSSMLQWHQANFVFHHSHVNRPITIQRSIAQLAQASQKRAEPTHTQREQYVQAANTSAQTAPAPKKDEHNTTDGYAQFTKAFDKPSNGHAANPYSTYACAITDTMVSSRTHAPNFTAVSSRWMLDLEPLAFNTPESKPSLPETIAARQQYHMNTHHQRIQTRHTTSSLVRSRLLTTVMQRIREL